ncbi:MAG: AmmeMemoRadiSam system protein B [candidate division WOR-3 bacterium]|nr:AmmeMemoRadiSam system protein B [candidate division WOR-3 bacterium]MCX7948377.1 AmmeMemoRadiSam system protein B [candidate division WOR-3 bacterium]MDW8151277.1 AmmeMemoRadiSam system protein B [candidate division WOR-3 bacterium]
MDFSKFDFKNIKLRTRHFEFEEIEDGFIVRDPFGFFDDLFFTQYAIILLSLFNGNRTIDEVKTEFFKITNILLSEQEIVDFIKMMDEYYLFYNERFINKVEEERKKLLNLEYKKITLVENITQLKNFIKENLTDETEENLIGLIVPHIDVKIAMDLYLKTYAKIKKTKRRIFFIFGVAHSLHLTPFSIFPRDYYTDKIVRVNKEILEKIQRQFGYEIDYDVLAYRNEHSVEFPIIFLDSFLEDITIIPSIIAYTNKKDDLKIISERIYKAIEPYKDEIFFISSIDLSHVGKKFGDKFYFDTKEVDLMYIDMLSNLKNDEAFDFLSKCENQTRIDGQFTNYVFLEVLKMIGTSKGKLIDYRNYYESLTDSGVSYCSVGFYI